MLRWLMLVAATCGALLCLAPLSHAQKAKTVQERLGYSADARLLVLHADDLGMAHSVNRATFEALEKRWVTSASILVPCPWFPEVVEFARTHPDADLGVHLALNSEWAPFRWGPLSGGKTVPSLVDEAGYFPLLETTVIERAEPSEVERELRAQIDWARAAGVRLTHLDSHMRTLFRTTAFFDVYRQLGLAYDLPLLIERIGDRRGSNSPWAPAAMDDALVDKVVTLAPGVRPSDWRAAYEKLLAPLAPGVYELLLHLAYDDDEMRGVTLDHPDWGAAWRQSDLDLVKSPEFQQFLRDQKFELIGWRELGKARTRP